MSLAVEVTVLDRGASESLKRLDAEIKPSRLAKRIGPACAKVTRSWLRALPSNRRGWPTTNFWPRAARATNWAETTEGVVVSINQIGVRQRYFGGVIAPVKRRALTIPISPEAYGKTAADFPGAFLLKTKRGAYIVQHGEEIGKSGAAANRKPLGPAKKRVRAFLEFLFKLSGSVNQQANPMVLPADDVYYVTARQAIMEALNGNPGGGA